MAVSTGSVSPDAEMEWLALLAEMVRALPSRSELPTVALMARPSGSRSELRLRLRVKVRWREIGCVYRFRVSRRGNGIARVDSSGVALTRELPVVALIARLLASRSELRLRLRV